MVTSSMGPDLPNAESIHRAFRGASEAAKLKRTIALLIEIAGVAFSAIILLDYWPNNAASALLLLGCAIVPVCFRLWADHDAGLARPWRREALGAYIDGRDLSNAEKIRVLRRVPWLSTRLADRLPAKKLDDYYAAHSAPGPRRRHEAYACSALYTASLQKIQFFIGLSLFLIVLAIASVSLVLLFESPPVEATRNRLTQILCSIIGAFIILRLIEFTVKAFQDWRSAESTVATLIEADSVSEDAVSRASLEYDFERSGSPSIPTWLYKWNRDRLEKRWSDAYAALEEKWSK